MPEEWKPQDGDFVWLRGEVCAVSRMHAEIYVGGASSSVRRALADLRPDTPAPLTDAEVLRRAADIMRCEGEHAGADIAYGFADRLAPPRVDVLAVLERAYVAVSDKGLSADLLAAIQQMRAA